VTRDALVAELFGDDLGQRIECRFGDVVGRAGATSRAPAEETLMIVPRRRSGSATPRG
jgi:hypothetical protein